VHLSDSSPPHPAISAARIEIADRLHEDICQMVSATSHLAAMLRNDLRARDAAETDQAEKVCSGLREASQALRKLIAELRVPH
jgi:glucose-6-phosphate-specific signal transduction histidine kinase